MEHTIPITSRARYNHHVSREVGRTKSTARLRSFTSRWRERNEAKETAVPYMRTVSYMPLPLFFVGLVTNINNILPSCCGIRAFKVMLDGIGKDFSLALAVILCVFLRTQYYSLASLHHLILPPHRVASSSNEVKKMAISFFRAFSNSRRLL